MSPEVKAAGAKADDLPPS